MTDARGLRPEWGDAPTLEELWEKVRASYFVADPGDPGELRRCLGYEAMVVKRRARQWLRAAEPDMDEGRLSFAVERAYERWASSLPSLRETQAVARIFSEAEAENEWRDSRSQRAIGLTREELEHLEELLQGANHPLSASIRAKATALLNR